LQVLSRRSLRADWADSGGHGDVDGQGSWASNHGGDTSDSNGLASRAASDSLDDGVSRDDCAGRNAHGAGRWWCNNDTWWASRHDSRVLRNMGCAKTNQVINSGLNNEHFRLPRSEARVDIGDELLLLAPALVVGVVLAVRNVRKPGVQALRHQVWAVSWWRWSCRRAGGRADGHGSWGAAGAWWWRRRWSHRAGRRR
jgi:hypothetical protein